MAYRTRIRHVEKAIETSPPAQSGRSGSTGDDGIPAFAGMTNWIAIVALLLIGAFLMLPPCPAPAQETKQLEEIKVESTPVDEATAQESTTFVSIIKPSESQDRLRDVSELLSESVGVQVRSFGGLGSQSTISIRGSSSDQVTVLLDGIPLNLAQSGFVDLSTLPLEDVERIEVYRGTAPVQYGTGAIGGLVNIVTKRAKGTRAANVDFSYGSFDTYVGNAFYSQQWDRFGVTGFFNYSSSKGDFTYFSDNGTPTNPNDDQELTRKNNDFESYNGFGSFNYEFANGWKLDLSNDFLTKDQGLPGTARAPTTKARLDTDRNITYLKMSKDGLGGTNLNFESKAYFIYQKEIFDDRLGEIGIGNQYNDNRTYAAGLETLYAYPLNTWNLLNFVLQGRHETFRSKNLLPGATDKGDNPQKRLTIIGGISDDIYLFDERLTLLPMVLATYYKNDFSGTLPFDVFAENVDNQSQDILFDLKMGARYRLTDYLTLKSNLGRYYRIPTFTELFGDRGGIVGNPDLQPEKSINADFGFIFEKRKYRFFDRIYFELAGFYSNVDDIIVFVQNSQNTFRAENVNSAQIIGLETSWSFNAWKHLLFSGNLTWQNPKDTSGQKLFNDKQLPGRAKFELFQHTELYFPYFRVFHELSILSQNFIDRANLRKYDSRTIQNAGVIIFPFGKKTLALSFEVKNFTDEQVEDIAGFPLPGRSYFGKATYYF